MKSKILSLFVFVLISTMANAADFIPVKLIDINGKEQTGYAKPINTGLVKHVLFKTTKDAKRQKISSDNLKTIIFSYSDGDIEYDRIRVYQGAWDKKPSKKSFWLKVIKRDYLTVYYGSTKATTYYVNGNARTEPAEKYWLFRREGENGATVVSLGGVINANSMFKASAQRYLKDYPELSKKIKNKEYKWKDVEKVAQLYNKWYAQKTN